MQLVSQSFMRIDYARRPVAYLGFHKGGIPPLPSLPFPSVPFPPSPPIPSLPSLALEVGPLLRLGGLGERLSSPSGSGRSPAAKRIFGAF